MSEPIPPNPDPPQELHGLDPGELLARGLHTVRPSGGAHAWTPPEPDELARLLPQYQIESIIGHGGMGAVYKGFQDKLARPVAIKLLPAELSADEQFVSRFEREARTLARLQHPGIVAIYDFGQTSEGHLYFVMEYVEGTDLRRVLQSPGLNPDQALELIVQVCEALQAAHRQGVIHRDIKPANILIATDGRVKLADFGLARPDYDPAEAGFTCSNVILGTPDYMAPEQHGGQLDHRADIFALGLMLYEMLTGQLPRGAFVPPSRKVQVDVRIDEVVIKALQEEPDRRYQQASEMKTDVDHIRTSVFASAAPSPKTPEPPKRWGRMVLAVAAVILAVPLIVGVLFLLRKAEPAAPDLAKPVPSHASEVAPPIAAASPPTQTAEVQRALLASKWLLSSRYAKRVVLFSADGAVQREDGSASGLSWQAANGNAFILRGEGSSTRLHFNGAFTRFEGRTIKGEGKLIGTPVSQLPTQTSATTPQPTNNPND